MPFTTGIMVRRAHPLQSLSKAHRISLRHGVEQCRSLYTMCNDQRIKVQRATMPYFHPSIATLRRPNARTLQEQVELVGVVTMEVVLAQTR